MKRLGLLLLLIFVGLTVWYLFIKDYHYRVRFESRQPAGVLFYHISDWNAYRSEGIDSVRTISSRPFKGVTQEVYSGGSYSTFDWSIEALSDSTSLVTAYITDEQHSISRKLKVPFDTDGFVKRSVKDVESVATMMRVNGENFRLNPVYDTIIPAQFCAFVSVQSNLNTKASSMMYRIGDVMSWVNEKEMELAGDPFVQLTSWDLERGIINYDFCFPIPAQDSIPEHPVLNFKTVPQSKVLATTYNGNYRLSHYAWYQLREYADRKGIAVDSLPVEHFLNDPHAGGNSLEWKAVVTLPYLP